MFIKIIINCCLHNNIPNVKIVYFKTVKKNHFCDTELFWIQKVFSCFIYLYIYKIVNFFWISNQYRLAKAFDI